MDEYVIVDRGKEVNVVRYDHEVYIAVENKEDRATVLLNPTQARKLAEMLTRAASLSEQ